MNGQVSVRDVMARSYVGVTEGDSLIGAAELMHDEQEICAVVLRGSDAVGTIHAANIVGMVAQRRDLDSVQVEDVMTPTTNTIPADADLETAVQLLMTNDGLPVVVEANNEVVGILSEHDVVTAYAVYTDAMAEEQGGTAPVADAGPVDAEYSDQGVCEVCGSLTRELTEHNGQLVCPDCLEM